MAYRQFGGRSLHGCDERSINHNTDVIVAYPSTLGGAKSTPTTEQWGNCLAISIALQIEDMSDPWNRTRAQELPTTASRADIQDRWGLSWPRCQCSSDQVRGGVETPEGKCDNLVLQVESSMLLVVLIQHFSRGYHRGYWSQDCTHRRQEVRLARSGSVSNNETKRHYYIHRSGYSRCAHRLA